MNRIVRFYNKNRYIIWIVIITIAGIILINKALVNNYDKLKTKDGSSSTSTTTSSENSYSVITGETIETEKNKSMTVVIDNFMNFCNNKNVEEAYNLISDDCKNQAFNNDINMFINNYYNKIFTENRLYSAQAWITGEFGNTYQVEITEDILSTGGNESDLKITDYFTIINENGKYKLNINNYVGNKTLNKTGEQENIAIVILNKKVYMDYEIYEIKFQNKNNFDVLLDTKQYADTTYMEGVTGQKYGAFMNELTDYELQLKNNTTKTLKIKFNKSYNPKYEIKNLLFTDLILNYQNNINVEKSNINIEF